MFGLCYRKIPYNLGKATDDQSQEEPGHRPQRQNLRDLVDPRLSLIGAYETDEVAESDDPVAI